MRMPIRSPRLGIRWWFWWTGKIRMRRFYCGSRRRALPHTGGERIKQNSPEEAVLKAWIAKLAQLSGVELATALKYRELESEGAGCGCRMRELRRLTHSQYNHTVRDLLGDQTAPATQFPAGGFRQRIPEPVPRAEPFAAA